MTVLLDSHSTDIVKSQDQGYEFLVGIDNKHDYGNLLGTAISLFPGTKTVISVTISKQEALEEIKSYRYVHLVFKAIRILHHLQ